MGKPIAPGLVLYDVCNDYSLDPAAEQEMPDPKTYEVESTNAFGGVVHKFYHKEYDELHYVLAAQGLSGRVLW